MEENTAKKKRHTSAAVINRYAKKTYARLVVNLDKDKAEKFKQKCAEKGINQIDVVRKAIFEYLGEDE